MVKWMSGLLGVLILMPIRIFLWYSLLKAAHADRLLWFLFWVYLGVAFAIELVTFVTEWWAESTRRVR
jgi:hypothetical protein